MTERDRLAAFFLGAAAFFSLSTAAFLGTFFAGPDLTGDFFTGEVLLPDFFAGAAFLAIFFAIANTVPH